MARDVARGTLVVARLGAAVVAAAPALVCWLLLVGVFGTVHHAVYRWLLDADASAWASVGTGALWASVFSVLGRRRRRGG